MQASRSLLIKTLAFNGHEFGAYTRLFRKAPTPFKSHERYGGHAYTLAHSQRQPTAKLISWAPVRGMCQHVQGQCDSYRNPSERTC